jgi:hypothetical protein
MSGTEWRGHRRGVGWRETGAKPEHRTRPDRTVGSRVFAAQRGCGRDRIRTCVGNAGDFTGRSAVSPRIPSRPHLLPITASDQHKWPVDCLRRPPTSPSLPACHARLGVGRREEGGKSGRHPIKGSTSIPGPVLALGRRFGPDGPVFRGLTGRAYQRVMGLDTHMIAGSRACSTTHTPGAMAQVGRPCGHGVLAHNLVKISGLIEAKQAR